MWELSSGQPSLRMSRPHKTQTDCIAPDSFRVDGSGKAQARVDTHRHALYKHRILHTRTPSSVDTELPGSIRDTAATESVKFCSRSRSRVGPAVVTRRV
jgi:hypothetical protein